MMRKLRVNGETREVEIEDADTPLLWVLRDELHLTGTKYGCGVAQCGACTVHIDGTPTRACSIAMSQAVDRDIVTIEGITGPEAEAVRKAWIVHDTPQCGYCQSGQIMSAIALLSNNKSPTDEDIDLAMNGNICRCATYHRIRAAIHDAAKSLGG
jgi:isoquinoline 1-oxidoreductase alpha subunit